MKKIVANSLKVGIPLAIGFWLIFYFYDQLDPDQREDLFAAFRKANMGWLLLATVVGWLSHVARAWRWRFLLEPLGYRPGFWNCYHAVMSGYFLNLFIPRAGEASRALSLYRTDQVPFEKGFGTIMAERVIDMLMLLTAAGVTLLLQLEKIDLFKARIDYFRSAQTPGESGGHWGIWVLAALLIGLAAGIYLLATKPALRAKATKLLNGFMLGLKSVVHTKKLGWFILYSFLIWTAYVAMFRIGFLALPEMAEVPWAGVLAGFIAGAIGIVLVQGGIGVYPAFVALIISVYMAPPVGGGYIRPEALAIGWLLWLVQTLMLIVLGGLSLLLLAIRKPSTHAGNSQHQQPAHP